MKITKQIMVGDIGGGIWYLDAASVPVDRFTRLLIRDLMMVISIDTGWAVLNAHQWCHRWLYRRIRRRPIQLTYEIYAGEEWQKFTVPVAVAV